MDSQASFTRIHSGSLIIRIKQLFENSQPQNQPRELNVRVLDSFVILDLFVPQLTIT
jgi:hypothetical protein